MAINNLISMRESDEGQECVDDLLQNVRILETESVQQNSNIVLQELTSVDTTDIQNLHSTLQEIIETLKG